MRIPRLSSRGLSARAAVLSALLALVLAALPGTALAAPYAAIVQDMRTGKTVHARAADRKQHPASLTKLMTLYLTFEAVKNGQLRLDQRVRVSRNAARQPASKLYLKAGQRISIRHLIRAAAIKSANDAAMVLAEAIGGSERAFARLMTQKARSLGMRSTTFKNPHGLTSRGHLSTARDMAILGRALYFHYPEYYNVFGKTHAYAAGKRVNTTNRLLRTYSGAEGMKTGYTRAAGYNLLATASRGDRRVLAVVMGGRSSRARNKRVAELLDMGFARTPRFARESAPTTRRKKARATASLVRAPMPRVRPGTNATGLAAVGSVFAGQAAASVPDPAGSGAPLYAALPKPNPLRSGPKDGKARRVARATTATAATAATTPGWMVQIGAFTRLADAERHLKRFDKGVAGELATARAAIERERNASGRALYKVRFRNLSRTDAKGACAKIKRAKRDCMAMAPR
ncbi:MAG: D-alanyl-D-alanine carboxypeptidase [Pseudomonadota bacterium]